MGTPMNHTSKPWPDTGVGSAEIYAREYDDCDAPDDLRYNLGEHLLKAALQKWVHALSLDYLASGSAQGYPSLPAVPVFNGGEGCSQLFDNLERGLRIFTLERLKGRLRWRVDRRLHQYPDCQCGTRTSTPPCASRREGRDPA